MPMRYFDFYSPAKRQKEIRELLTWTDRDLRRLDLDRDELLDELGKFDSFAAGQERLFPPTRFPQ